MIENFYQFLILDLYPANLNKESSVKIKPGKIKPITSIWFVYNGYLRIMLLFLRSCDSSFKLSPKTRTEEL